jgi:hypothetical protein
MSLLWAVAPVAVAIGVGIAVIGLRRIAAESDELAAEITRVREVRDALTDLRAASDDTVARVRGMRRD